MFRKYAILLLVVLLVFPPPSITSEPDNMFAISGFATQNGGTTGGTGGVEKHVTTGQEIIDLLGQKRHGEITQPLIIYVEDTITPANTPVEKIDIKDVSDVSIIGVGKKGEFNGIGIKIKEASNIIIKNLTIHHVDIGEKDCIGIEGPANNIWVDHCELYNDLDHDKDYYDGLLDAKRNCEYITVSWCYMHDSYKTSLVGSSDDDDFDRKITYHHNYIANCNSRLPSYRFGTGHIFNNYYADNLNTGINCRQGAKLKIESNYFENFKDPIGYWYSDETGFWDVSNNMFVNCTGSMPETSTTTFDPPYDYSDVLTPVEDVKEIVLQYCGPQEEGLPSPSVTVATTPTPAPTDTPTLTPEPTDTPVPATPTPTIVTMNDSLSTTTPKNLKTIVELTIGDPYMYVNSKREEIDPGRGTTAIIIQERTLIPIRAVMEAVGCFVTWNAKEKRVTITIDDTIVKIYMHDPEYVEAPVFMGVNAPYETKGFYEGGRVMNVNGIIKVNDVAPIIMNNRMFLPFRFVAESVGSEVSWDGDLKKVTLKHYEP